MSAYTDERTLYKFYKKLDCLIHAVIRYEVDYIQILRNREINGDSIDLNVILNNENNLNRLGSEVAWNIVSNYIYENKSLTVGNYESLFYKTETGKRYHVADCHYCR